MTHLLNATKRIYSKSRMRFRKVTVSLLQDSGIIFCNMVSYAEGVCFLNSRCEISFFHRRPIVHWSDYCQRDNKT